MPCPTGARGPESGSAVTKAPLIVQSVQANTSWFETQAAPAPHHEEWVPHPEERPIGRVSKDHELFGNSRVVWPILRPALASALP